VGQCQEATSGACGRDQKQYKKYYYSDDGGGGGVLLHPNPPF